jgi:hypothetical protein
MLEQSLRILEQALNGANKAGVYTLQESEVIAQAFRVVSNECQVNKDTKEVEVENKEVKSKQSK